MIAFHENSAQWHRVSQAHRCPVCEKPDWCSVTGPEDDPEAVVCMRVQSDNQRGNGGWLHRLRPSEPASSGATRPPVRSNTKTYANHAKTLAAWEGQRGEASAVYVYENPQGEAVGLVARWDQANGKTIRQASRQADGLWVHKAMPASKPLYRLPELLSCDERVYVVEGEKCVEALRAIGLTATTWPGGSSAVGKADFSPLEGRDVVLLADNDDVGGKAMDNVTKKLAALSPQPTIRQVELPDLSDRGDVVDWIEAHHGTANSEVIATSLRQLADVVDPIELASLLENRHKEKRQPSLLCMVDVESKPIRWLWAGRFAAGRLSLLVGMPGAGKSFLTCDMAARISTGMPWPDGESCEQGSVVFITAEDDPHDTIRPRLDAHQADPTRIHLLRGIKQNLRNDTADETKGGTDDSMFSLEDVDILRQTLDRIPDCRLIVIDPIGSFLGGRTDAHRDNEVRAILSPIAKLAEEYGAAVLIVVHRRKGNATHADDMALGSRAFTGIARSVWHLMSDTENKDRRLVLPGKSNLSPDQGGLAFTISGEPAQLQWEHERVTMSADEALARENGRGSGDASAFDEAADWLQNALADGSRPSNELKSAAKNDGISARTLERAKKKLRVESGPGGFGGPWVWRLPGTPNRSESATLRQESTESAKENTLAECGETVADTVDAPS